MRAEVDHLRDVAAARTAADALCHQRISGIAEARATAWRMVDVIGRAALEDDRVGADVVRPVSRTRRQAHLWRARRNPAGQSALEIGLLLRCLRLGISRGR